MRAGDLGWLLLSGVCLACALGMVLASFLVE